MGAGKSSLGKRLAEGLGCAFYDLDRLIEKGEGMDIPTIFEKKGEAVFRELEAKHLRNTVHLPTSIIATGGGAPCFLQNMEWMNGQGLTIYLQASADTILQRLRKEKSGRPLLAEKTEFELETYIEELLSKRERFYLSAHFTCRTDLRIDQLVPPLIQYFDRFFL